MAAGIGVHAGDQLALLHAEIDHLATDSDWQLTDDQLLRRVDQLGVLTQRLTGLRMRALHETHRRKICEEQQGWTLANHLVTTEPQSLTAARATVKLADDLGRYEQVGSALTAGRISVAQARAIVRPLAELPAGTDDDHLDRAQQTMIDHARRFDPAGLRRIGNHLVDVISPDAVDDTLGRQLERQEQRARRDRFLSWQYDGEGSIALRGKLPVVAGEAFIGQVEAYTQQTRTRGLDRGLDPEAEITTTAQRHADGLIAMVQDVAARGLAPTVAGDRPRAVITVQYADLLAGIRCASLVSSGQPIAPGTARRIACSGDLLPAVLGGPSAVLDVGRAMRLFTGPLRTALVLRDGGCAFPGCDAPPARCEGHHLQPWWAGGRTALDNGVLVCGHHHDLVEPDPRARPGSRWEIRLDQHGLPEVLPPDRIDPRRKPRQHSRFAERSLRQRR